MALDPAVTWRIVHAALSGFMLIPLFIIGVVATCTVRRHRDPARTGFTWMKIAFLFEILAVIFLVTWDGLNAYYMKTILDGFRTRQIANLILAMNRINYVYGLFERVADVFMIITLVEVGAGFMRAISGTKSSLQRILFFASIAAAVVLTILNLAIFGRRIQIRLEYERSGNLRALNSALIIMQKVGSTFDIMSWIMSLALVGLGAMVFIQSKGKLALRSSAFIYLVVTILWSIRWLLIVIIDATWILPIRPEPQEWIVADAIAHVWLFVITLVLLWVIGMRKQDRGVWSTQKQQAVQDGGHVYGQPQVQMAY